jgi:hypothetical protein
MEAAHNWWIKARAVLSQNASRGEHNTEKRYKLLGHVLFQKAHARWYSSYVWGSKESSGPQRNQTFRNRANSTAAFNTDHDYQKIMNESFGTSFHCINKTSKSTQTQSLFSYCIRLQSYRSVWYCVFIFWGATAQLGRGVRQRWGFCIPHARAYSR